MVKSPIKIIDSGTAPTTENLGEGQIAFGTVDGATKLYGSDGTTVSELGGGGGSEVNSIAPLTTETPPIATGPYSISIGDRAKSTAQSSVSFGPSAVASGTASLSIGFRSNSSSPDTTAIGSFASASDSGSLSIGTRASSTLSSVSVGTGSESSNQGTAIGYGANATSTYLNSGSTSIGASASAPGLSAVAVGYGSESSADMAAAMGYNSSAAGLRSVAIGSDSAATSTDEFSIGSDSLQRRITHVSDPTNDQDAATKKYVDTKVSEIPAGPQGDPGEPGPQGEPGAPGAAATITVGTTTTGEAGTEASVTNSGSTSAAVLNFTIPKGAKGDKGDTGSTGPAGTTTFAGLTDQPTDNAALKTALDAKANQTAVDSLTSTVNGKVASITAGEGISITGTATEPVISATGGTVISGLRLDYANAQTVSIEALTSWTSPSDGYFVVATWVGVPGPGGRTSFTVNGASVVDPNYGASASALPDLPTYLPLSKGDVIATEFESGVRGTFYPLKNSTLTPNEFTDTGWMEITNSSGDGLPYLTGPFVIPSGSSLKIRKYGKRVNLIGTVQITEDLTYTNTEDFISIKQDQTVSSQAQFDDPPGTTTEVNEDYSRFMPLGNRYSELQFTDHGQIAECCYGFAAYNKISPTNGNSLRVKIAPAFSTSISNGTIININLSWDTED